MSCCLFLFIHQKTACVMLWLLFGSELINKFECSTGMKRFHARPSRGSIEITTNQQFFDFWLFYSRCLECKNQRFHFLSFQMFHFPFCSSFFEFNGNLTHFMNVGQILINSTEILTKTSNVKK